MAKARTLVGLDVHAAKVVAAVLDAETGELRFQRLGGESEPVVRLCGSLAGPVRASYEAGPTGYGLARALEGAGVECVVAAPGKIPRGATERVKTDRRDAEHLVRLLLAGKLCPVRVPGPAEEALRDLVRAREDLCGDLMRARHRLSKLLLRHDVRFGGRAWSERHRAWLANVELDEQAAQATLDDYRGAIEALLHRKAELERQIQAAIPAAPWAREVGRLRCLRGVDTLTAVGLCAEIGDFERFARAGRLMSYLGLMERHFSVVMGRYQAGKLSVVTSEFPGVVRRDARRNFRRYLKVRRHPSSFWRATTRRALAVWVADQCLLQRCRQALRTVRLAHRRGELRKFYCYDFGPYGRAYIRKLKRMLRRYGYLGFSL